jgi:WD40-like Beta Propeller Repeat
VVTACPALADQKPRGWSMPVATVGGGCPIESRDGNYLYTASNSAGTLDIWVYRREVSRHGFEFVDRTLLGPPVSLPDAQDFCPTPVMGDWLMFVSTRSVEGACDGADIFLTEYQADPPGSLGEAKHLACAPDGPNTAGTEFSPSLITTPDGIFLYYSSDSGGNQDIYVSEMAPDGSFGPGTPVAELNTPSGDQQPNVSRDGLTIVFASNRDGGGVMDIYVATRDSVEHGWSSPVNLSHELNFPTMSSSETRPSLSWDGERLYYGADGIVYVSERSLQGRHTHGDDHRPPTWLGSWLRFLFD